MRPWLQRRPLLGQYEHLMHELREEDVPGFRNFLRVEPAMFHELLQRVGPRICKPHTFYRRSLDPGLKLAITMRFLATGDSYHSLMYAFRVPHNTISLVVREVCEQIFEEYGPEVLSCPTSPDEWRAVADKFKERWQFPNAVGALDGKHVAIRCPKRGGSLYYNFKGFHSIVLLALVDAEYKFLWADVGANGAASDAQIFTQCELREAIEDRSIGLPPPQPLPGDDRPTPFFLVADDAFPLRTWLMKPFSSRRLTDEERIFNYRLSRARRISENAFGILANRFGCFLTTLALQPVNVVSVVLSALCLHNLMRIRYPGLQNAVLDMDDANHQVVPGTWRNQANMQDMENLPRGNRTTRAAKAQRLYMKHYVNSPAGSVPWQGNMI